MSHKLYTLCETSELELFHIQIVSHTDLWERQKRLHINNIMLCTLRHSDNQAAQRQVSATLNRNCTDRQTDRQTCSFAYREKKRAVLKFSVTQLVALNTCCHYSKDCCGSPLLTEMFEFSKFLDHKLQMSHMCAMCFHIYDNCRQEFLNKSWHCKCSIVLSIFSCLQKQLLWQERNSINNIDKNKKLGIYVNWGCQYLLFNSSHNSICSKQKNKNNVIIIIHY